MVSFFFFADGRTVTLAQFPAVQFDVALGNLQPGVTLVIERLGNLFSGYKQSDEQLRVLIDLYRTLGSVARSNQPQLAALLGFGEASLFVARFQPLFVGKNPYLQQVHGFGRRRIRLAMADAAPRGHALPVARKDHRAGAQAVFVFELARQDIGDDLHVAMRMCRETAAGRNPIFIDHAQRAEPHSLGVGVIVKTESMARLQPAVVAAAALTARSDGHHGCSLLVSRCNNDWIWFRCPGNGRDAVGAVAGR